MLVCKRCWNPVSDSRKDTRGKSLYICPFCNIWVEAMEGKLDYRMIRGKKVEQIRVNGKLVKQDWIGTGKGK